MRSLLACLVLVTTAAIAQGQTPDADALFEAAQRGDRARVAALLDQGVDVNARSRYGATALGFAADRGHLDVVRLLVERGADLHVSDSFYSSRPIDFALRGGHMPVALYLLERGSPGAVAVLNQAIRRKDRAAATAALATRQADADALAAARALAEQSGDAALVALIDRAAPSAPARSAAPIALDPATLRVFEGRYQSAGTGAPVSVAVVNGRLTLAGEAQPTLTLQPVEERRFVAETSPDLVVTFAGRGGLIERLSIARDGATVRYEREGFGDATSPAPAPETESSTRPATTIASATPAAQPASAADPIGAPRPWPAFRGANAAGVADGQGAVADWNIATGHNVRWKTPIPGLAISSPIVWGDLVIVVAAASDDDTSFRTGLYGDVKPVDNLSPHSFRVYALDRTTGRVAWEREAFNGPPLTKRHTKSSQANATPVTDGHHIVAVFGAVGLMVCYDMEGTLLWTRELGALDSGWFLDPSYQWGHASSPIIYKSSVIVQADQAKDSFIAAFDLATGRELWRTAREDEVSTWGTPTILSTARGDEIVTNGTTIRGYDAASGRLLWTLRPNSEIAVGTPVVHGDLAIVTGGYPPVRPIYAVRAGARGDISLASGQSSNTAIAWSHDRDGTYISTPLVYRGQLYMLNQNGILAVYDADTGERLYRARVGGGGAFSASPVAADGRIYLASEDGDVYVIEAGRQYVEVGKHEMSEPVMATPAISGGLIIVRTLTQVWGLGR